MTWDEIGKRAIIIVFALIIAGIVNYAVANTPSADDQLRGAASGLVALIILGVGMMLKAMLTPTETKIVKLEEKLEKEKEKLALTVQ